MLGAAGVSVYPPPRRCPYGRHRRGSGARAVPTAMRRCCTAAMTSSTHVIAELRLAVLREHVIETWSVLHWVLALAQGVARRTRRSGAPEVIRLGLKAAAKSGTREHRHQPSPELRVQPNPTWSSGQAIERRRRCTSAACDGRGWRLCRLRWLEGANRGAGPHVGDDRLCGRRRFVFRYPRLGRRRLSAGGR